MIVYNLAWAMAPPAQQSGVPQAGEQPQGWMGLMQQYQGLIPIILIFVVFYWLLIRPQQKERRALQEMINNLKKGDKVITTGGMYGTVVDLKEKTITLKIGDNVKVEFLRNAISGMQKSKKIQ